MPIERIAKCAFSIYTCPHPLSPFIFILFFFFPKYCLFCKKETYIHNVAWINKTYIPASNRIIALCCDAFITYNVDEIRPRWERFKYNDMGCTGYNDRIFFLIFLFFSKVWRCKPKATIYFAYCFLYKNVNFRLVCINFLFYFFFIIIAFPISININIDAFGENWDLSCASSSFYICILIKLYVCCKMKEENSQCLPIFSNFRLLLDSSFNYKQKGLHESRC